MSAPSASPQQATLAARDLTKRFGDRVALARVGFEARPGELLAVIGPNGAGKTTLLSIVAGIVTPDEGTITSPGRIGWVPQQVGLYRRLTVEENLRLFARLEGVEDTDAVVDRMLAIARLEERRSDPIGSLSGGNQQRVNIAVGLLSEPAVLLLDEPSTGLDPPQRERLWEFVSELAGAGTTVLFSTHHIGEAERYGTRLLVIADGEVVLDGTAADLHAAVPESGAADFEAAFVAFLRERGH